MPITVYTCITGLYDRLIPQPADEGTRYVCFTDRPDVLNGPGWEVRPLLDPGPVKDTRLMARYHKVMCYDLFPDTPTSIYIDGSVLFSASPSAIVSAFLASGAAIAAQPHSRRVTAAAEMEACITVGKITGDQTDRARRMLEIQREEGFRDDQGLTNTSFLVRDTSSAALRRAMDRWWQQISTWVPRDQLSFEYSLWSEGLSVRHFRKDETDQLPTFRLRHGTTRPPLVQRLRRGLGGVRPARPILGPE